MGGGKAERHHNGNETPAQPRDRQENDTQFNCTRILIKLVYWPVRETHNIIYIIIQLINTSILTVRAHSERERVSEIISNDKLKYVPNRLLPLDYKCAVFSSLSHRSCLGYWAVLKSSICHISYWHAYKTLQPLHTAALPHVFHHLIKFIFIKLNKCIPIGYNYSINQSIN